MAIRTTATYAAQPHLAVTATSPCIPTNFVAYEYRAYCQDATTHHFLDTSSGFGFLPPIHTGNRIGCIADKRQLPTGALNWSHVPQGLDTTHSVHFVTPKRYYLTLLVHLFLSTQGAAPIDGSTYK